MRTKKWSFRILFVYILLLWLRFLPKSTLLICQGIAKVNVELGGRRDFSSRVHPQVGLFWYALSPWLPVLSVQLPSPQTWKSVRFPPTPNIHPIITSFPFVSWIFLKLSTSEYWNGLIIPALSSPDPSPRARVDWLKCKTHHVIPL